MSGELVRESKVFDPPGPIEVPRPPIGTRGPRFVQQLAGDRGPNPRRSPSKGKGSGRAKAQGEEAQRGPGPEGQGHHQANAQKLHEKRRDRNLAVSQQEAASGADH